MSAWMGESCQPWASHQPEAVKAGLGPLPSVCPGPGTDLTGSRHSEDICCMPQTCRLGLGRRGKGCPWIRKGGLQKAGGCVFRAPKGSSRLGLSRAPGVGSGHLGQPSPCQSCELGTSLWDSLLGRMGWRNRAGTVGNRYNLSNSSPALPPLGC